MEEITCTDAPAAASCLPSNVFARDANPSEDPPFPLSDDELFELAVMICLVAGAGSSRRTREAGVDCWGGA